MNLLKRLLIRDVRKQWVRWALKLYAMHRAHPGSMVWVEVRPFTLPRRSTFLGWVRRPWRGDCSASLILISWLAGGRDFSGNNFDGDGNTTSFLAHGEEITLEECVIGDVIVYADVHAVMIVAMSGDPLCFSFGQAGDPHLVRNSVLMGLGTPHYLRFSSANRRLK